MPVFFAFCPLYPPSPSPLRKPASWRCEVFLSHLAVDTGAQDHSASTARASPPDWHGSLCHVCSFFCQGYAHATSYTTSLPPRIGGHLWCWIFLPCSPYGSAVGWETFPQHFHWRRSFLSTPRQLCPLPLPSPGTGLSTSAAPAEAAGCQAPSAAATAAWPAQLGSAPQSPRWSPQKLIPCWE